MEARILFPFLCAFSLPLLFTGCPEEGDDDTPTPALTPDPTTTPSPSPTPEAGPSPTTTPSPSPTPLLSDGDGDGYEEDDCDDTDSTVHPGAPEDGGSGTDYGDGKDNDCDGIVDEGTFSFDDDNDGYSEIDGDCDDADPNVHPGDEGETCSTPLIIPLSLADLSFIGEGEFWHAGYSVAAAGDVNADGYDDVLIGTHGTEEWTAQGKSYLLLGGEMESGNLADADALYEGEEAWDVAGYSVAAAGDLDADGFDDLLIGAPLKINRSNNNQGEGAAYLIYGPSEGYIPLKKSRNWVQSTISSERLGDDVAGIGDINGDGYDDILMGGPNVSETLPGNAYIFFGPVLGELNNDDADIVFHGEDISDMAGSSVAFAGDVNGDGHPDILIGAMDGKVEDAAPGKAYLFYGPLSGGDIELAEADVLFIGDHDGDDAGRKVASAGDVNGDGYDDILIGAPRNTEGAGAYSGSAHLFFGPLSGEYHLAEADAVFLGTDAYDFTGLGLASAGDFNGDGYGDILIGAPAHANYVPDYTGKVYLFLGPVEGELTPARAFALLMGENGRDQAGWAVANAGDLNGDGLSDIVIGAPGNEDAGGSAGKAYVVYGFTE